MKNQPPQPARTALLGLAIVGAIAVIGLGIEPPDTRAGAAPVTVAPPPDRVLLAVAPPPNCRGDKRCKEPVLWP